MSFFVEVGTKKPAKNSKKPRDEPVKRVKPVKRMKTRQTKHASAKRVREAKPDGRGDDNEEITSSSDSGASDDDFLNIEVDEKKLQRKKDAAVYASDDEANETAGEKRLRLAKVYLSELERRHSERLLTGNDENDDATTKKAVSETLKEESQLLLNRQHRALAASVRVDVTAMRARKVHYHNLNELALSGDARTVVSGHIDGTIVKYDIETGKTINQIFGLSTKLAARKSGDERRQQHTGSVNGVTMSHDDSTPIFCTGGDDKSVRIWDLNNMQHIKSFNGHRQSVTCVSLRRGTRSQLFSGSRDRTVRAWDVAQMGYVDTMFGHTDTVAAVDTLARERSVSCGSGDRSVRVWKMAAESQLVFNGLERAGSIDTVRLVNEEHFVTGAQDGSVSVWSAFKKKPVCTANNVPLAADGAPSCSWVCAVAACPYTDLVASGLYQPPHASVTSTAQTGSADGYIRLWQIAADYKSITCRHKIPVTGFINSLAFSDDGRVLVAGVGVQHKRGRWFESATGMKNAIVTIPLSYS